MNKIEILSHNRKKKYLVVVNVRVVMSCKDPKRKMLTKLITYRIFEIKM